MSILDFMCGKSAERAANLIREQEEMLAQSRIRHEIALLHAIRPRSRTSTLRVRTIRWKRYSPIVESETIKRLSNLGASVQLWHVQKGCGITVTWPEARK